MRTGWRKQHLYHRVRPDDQRHATVQRDFGPRAEQGLLDFGDLVWVETWHSSNYNSFQASFQRDIGSLRFLAAYTFSKAIDDSSGLQRSLDKSL